MRRFVPLLLPLIILLSTCRFAADQVSFACAPGSYDLEISSRGQTRLYRLHIPAGYKPNTPVPLLLGFHGAGSTGLQFESYTGFSALADEFGYIAAYPNGLGDLSNWDTMPDSTDVPFVRDLIDEIGKRCRIDPARIYATGHSRGGGMVNRLGCELADRIAAIGPVSGDYEFSETCFPSRPMPVVSFHGTGDEVLPYNGFGLPGQIHETYLRIGTPIAGWAASWGDRDGCDPKPRLDFQSGLVSGQRWSQCEGFAEVILYTVEGGEHGWPTAVDAAAILWDFFMNHPLPKAEP